MRYSKKDNGGCQSTTKCIKPSSLKKSKSRYDENEYDENYGSDDEDEDEEFDFDEGDLIKACKNQNLEMKQSLSTIFVRMKKESTSKTVYMMCLISIS